MVLLGIGAFLGSFVVGYGVFGLLRKWRIIDRPNERSSHDQPTVRGGGIGIMVVILGGTGWLGWHERARIVELFGTVVLLLALVSFLDDRESLPWRVRLGTHFGAAAIMLGALLHAEVLAAPVLFGLSGLFVLLWFAGYANVFNFMDGINGLAAGQAVVTGLGISIVGLAAGLTPHHPAVVLGVVLAGAAGGFLPQNFPRARMFMGDVSSVPLGFMLAVLTVWVARDAGWWLLVPLGTLHANFWMDSGITLVRRLLCGEAFHQAHREHFYQRLVRAKKSHTFVTLLEMGLQSVVLGLLALCIHAGASVRLILVAAVIMIWISFFAWAEMCFRRFMAEHDQAVAMKIRTASRLE
jgi:UDP-N-acetylmuramyl pentapeptide phosphotransferase/UDP-N-acetylglucosamine-1-phosphate transferase